MKMADNPKLDLETDSPATSCKVRGLDEMEDTRKISISDHINGFQHTGEKSDSFVVDLESFPHGNDKDITANSRITRSFSRKGMQRGGEKKTNSSTTAIDGDTVAATSSPRAPALAGASTLERPVVVTLGTMDHPINPLVHHQITITAANIGTTATAESIRGGLKRCGSRRSPPSRVFDPRRILFFFATLSSMGTILLIYFTLSMGKLGADDDTPN